MKLFVLCIYLAACSIPATFGDEGRYKRQIPITAGTYFPPNTELTEDGVPILQQPYSRRQTNPHYTGPHALEHYTHYVNDPYVNTEDLGSIIGGRPRPRPQARPELRSGSESNTNDGLRWSSSSQQSQSRSQYSYPPQQQQQQQQQPPRRYQTNSINTYQNQRRPYNYNDQVGNGEWEVADKGDNHITYRRRHSSRQEWERTPSLQRFDTQDGQVMAQVVDMRRENPNNAQSRESQSRRRQSDHRRTSSSETYGQRSGSAQRPETRSLDSNPSIFPGSDTSVSGNGNVNAYWQQRRAGASTVTSSWPTPYSPPASSDTRTTRNNYDSRRQESFRNEYRQTTPRFEPNYPILYDRETADKSGVQNTVVVSV